MEKGVAGNNSQSYGACRRHGQKTDDHRKDHTRLLNIDARLYGTRLSFVDVEDVGAGGSRGIARRPESGKDNLSGNTRTSLLKDSSGGCLLRLGRKRAAQLKVPYGPVLRVLPSSAKVWQGLSPGKSLSRNTSGRWFEGLVDTCSLMFEGGGAKFGRRRRTA